MRTFLFLLSLGLVFGASKCEKTACNEANLYVAEDHTGLDGCTLLFKDESGQLHEPSNLSNFDIKIEEGKKYWIASESISMASICMMGSGMEITCIELAE